MEQTSVVNSTNTFQTQTYTSKDGTLLNGFDVSREFGAEQDTVELHIYNANNQLLRSLYNFPNYTVQTTTDNSSLYDTVYLDPETDLKSLGYNLGKYNPVYNFYRPLFLSNPDTRFFIKEISSDRTEIKVTTNDISYDALGTSYFNYITSKTGKSFYSDFLLNFGENRTLIGVNTLLDTATTAEPSIFIKLYEPLPNDLEVKDTLWFVEQVSDPYSFTVDIQFIAEEEEEQLRYLRGPNTDIDLNKSTNFTTKYFNINEILDTTLTSSYQQVKSVLEEKSIDINIDHTDYTNFVHFGSAYERLENFKYKLTLIQNYQSDLNQLKDIDPLTDESFISASKSNIQQNIDTLIEKFDNYEYYLYFESGSKAWPKSNQYPPYDNYSITSESASVWYGSIDETNEYYGGQILSASLYDQDNRDYVWTTLPAYVQEDVQNQNLELLVSMLGQHFDYIWTYTKAIGDIKEADNRPDFGISKELVANALRSLGIKLYTTNRTNEDIFTSILGVSPSGSLVPDTGSYRIETYVSASNEVTSYDDINKEVYKRIYHNLPYLLKTKGTRKGLRALLNCFGIPADILRIQEYGGNQKNIQSVTQYHEVANSILDTRQTSSIKVPWLPTLMPIVPDNWGDIEQDWNNIEGWWNGVLAEDQVPDTIEFRFKPKGIPSASHYTQSIFQVNNSDSSSQFGVQLLYSSESNAALGGDVYDVYGELRFVLSGSQGYTSTDPIYLPFFSGGFWDLKLDRSPAAQNLNDSGSSNITYELIVKSGQYDGNNNFIDFQASSSLEISGSTSASYNEAWNNYLFSSGNTQFYGFLGGASSSNIIAPDGVIFDGYFQEFRYWITNLSQSAFDQHVLNPTSYVDNDLTSSYYNLIYRLPLGNYDFISGSDGDNRVYTVHPMSTGSYAPTASFLGTGSSTVNYGVITNFTTSSFVTHSNVDLVQGPDIGAFTLNETKVRTQDYPYASGSTLSPYVSIQESILNPYTADLDVAEIGVSIQNSIDSDIINQIGFFDIDEYIGDPNLAASSSYPDLNELRDFYFKKYYKETNYTDIVKALSYYDSSLFKMLKDWVPAKTLLNTGLVIKPHILERNKTEKFEPSFTYVDYSGSYKVVEVTGSTPMGKALNTTYTGEVTIPSSSANTITASGVIYNFTDNREPFTGEYSGSEIRVYQTPTSSTVFEINTFNNLGKDIDNDFSISVSYSAIPFNPTFNNISEARKSVQYMDIDYSSNVITPVNINFITSRSFGELTEQETAFLDAPVQDSNYTLLRNVNPRYLGSKNTSKEYNTYNIGDTSYGQTAAIDLNSLKFAYFSEIVETGSFFPDRSNVYIKYLIDGRSNVTELTRKNETIFEVQNIFNAKKQANISLDDNQLFSDQKYLDGLKPVYAGGFRYLPTLQNPTGSATLVYNFTTGSLTNIDKSDLKELPGSLGGEYVKISNFTLGTIQIQNGSNDITVGGYPAITLTRNTPVNQSSIWWDNDLVVNVEGQVQLELNIPKNISASIDQITWNPFDGAQPIISSSEDLGEFALLKATYHVTNSVTLPKNTQTTEAILSDSPSAMGGYFETSFSPSGISSASVNIGEEAARYGTPEYTYYFPSEPLVSLTSSIEDGGDTDNGDAFFLRNTTSSFNILTASVSMSYWYGNFVQTSSVYESGSDSFGIVDEEFIIKKGDIFRFVDKIGGEAGTGSGYFPVEFERQVKKVNTVFRDEVTNTRRLTIEFDKDIPARACEDFDSASPEDAREIKRFIILKKVEDETNIVLNFKKQEGRTSSGIVLPADIPQSLQDRAGNIVKELKAQNLIS